LLPLSGSENFSGSSRNGALNRFCEYVRTPLRAAMEETQMLSGNNRSVVMFCQLAKENTQKRLVRVEGKLHVIAYSVHHYTLLHSILEDYTVRYILIQHYTSFYCTTRNYTRLYTPKQHYTALYTPIQRYTPLYSTIHP